MPNTKPQIALVGGGLANSLIALALMEMRPEVDFILLEQGDTLGGNHTWSFFNADVGPGALPWLAPLISYRWPAYEVRFPRRRRRLNSPYASIRSAQLDAVLRPRLGERAIFGANAVKLTPRTVELADGRVFEADLVIDGRGPRETRELAIGYQKFVGQLVRLARPHGVSIPIIMDATVPQIDGYRFVYVLPLDDTRLLIEDTRYSDGPAVDPADFKAGIAAYAEAHGWEVAAIEDEEIGVLPVALEGDIEGYWEKIGPVPQSGLRAVMFHPTTGYSLPDAVRLAQAIAAAPVFTAESIGAMIRERSIALWNRRGIYRLCNRMVFRAGLPSLRFKIFQRFYGLSQGLIRRFYAAELNRYDRTRILVGKPPVPFFVALGCIEERKKLE
jgi:lycopene beta-cyclase